MNHNEDTFESQEDYPVHNSRPYFPMELGRSIAEMWQLVKKQHQMELEAANSENRKLRAENELILRAIGLKAGPTDLMKLPLDVRSYVLMRGADAAETNALQSCLRSMRDDAQRIFNLTHEEVHFFPAALRRRVAQLAYTILHMDSSSKERDLI